MKDTDITKWVSRKLKDNTRDTVEADGKLMCHRKFTEHMKKKAEHGNTPEIEAFHHPSDMFESIGKEIQRSPKGKAAGTDHIFVESMQLAPDTTEKFLAKLWERCSQISYVI